MFGLRNKSVIFKIRRPETRIGRHNTNHVVLTKSLKVSRFHAVINFLSDTPLIRDISEWGVYLNGTPIGKNRWAELKLGDMLALGALKVEDGGHLLEVVLWDTEDKNPIIPNPKVEVIDITQGEDEVISISDEEASEKKCATSQAPPEGNHVPEKIQAGEIMVISDGEEESEQPTISCEPAEIPVAVTKVDEVSRTEETLVLSNETKFATDASTQFEETPLANENVPSNEIKFVNTTMTSVVTTRIDEVPLMDENMVRPPNNMKFVDSARSNDTKFVDGCAQAIGTKFVDDCAQTTGAKFVDVTTTMNGLLLQTSIKLPPDLAELPQAFQNIMNYTSEDESSYDGSADSNYVYEESKFDDRDDEFSSSPPMSTDETAAITPEIAADVEEEVKAKRAKIERDFYNGYGYKSPLNVYSRDFDDDAESSDLSEAEAPEEESPKKEAEHIVHRTLLTNKIAKIAIISPLPNKVATRGRRRRIRKESADSIDEPAATVERTTRSRSRKSKRAAPEPQKADEPKVTLVADPIRDKAAKKESMKQAREKVKALYYGLPVRPERNPSTRPQPKVKITDKNRGDFLTKLELAPAPRNPAKSHNEPRNYDSVASNQPSAKSPNPEKPKTHRAISSEATKPKPRYGARPAVEPQPSPGPSHEPRKSIDEILDGIDIETGKEPNPTPTPPPPPPPRDDFNDVVVPIRRTDRTIEVRVDFSKPPPIPGSNSKAMGGGSILKKSNEASPPGKKRVRFPSEISTSRDQEPKKCLGPPNCFDCGENCLSRKLSQKDRVVETCYNCFRDGHTAKDCTRPVLCYNCKGFGHKGNDCPLPDVRKVKQLVRDPRIKQKINKITRWDVNRKPFE